MEIVNVRGRAVARRIACLAGLLVLAGLVQLGVGFPVEASGPLAGTDGADRAASTTTYTRKFSATRQRYFSTINRCVRVTVRGELRFQLKPHDSYTGTYVARRVRHPSLTVQTFAECIVGPQVGKAVYKMQLAQKWSSSTCSKSVSIGISAPWGVSVGGSLSCGESNRAVRRSSYTGSSASRTQWNSTTVVPFGDEYWKPIAYAAPYGGQGELKRYPLCFEVDAAAVVYPTRKSGSDSYTGALKPCVRYW